MPADQAATRSREGMSRQLKGSSVAGNGRLMGAAGVETFGGEVQMLELATPQSLTPDEVVIVVRAAGVGNWDEIVRVGGWDVGRQRPLVLGVEAAGVVVAVGEEVTSLAPGDEVLTHPLPLRHQGTRAERLVAPAFWMRSFVARSSGP
jgi:NADPH:quinone reductase-like Zn-dependent oxidoreductase